MHWRNVDYLITGVVLKKIAVMTIKGNPDIDAVVEALSVPNTPYAVMSMYPPLALSSSLHALTRRVQSTSTESSRLRSIRV